MKIKELQNTFHEQLDAFYEKEEVDSFFFMLIAHYYEIARIQLAMDTDLVISNSKKIIEALELLKRQKPIQYIIGETEFYGLEFKVNEHVLIPRPETEELVSWVISEFNTKKKPLRILDIGTGSGCIAISLAKNLRNVKVYALDVSKEALKVAKGNAELNAVDIEFLELDVLETKRIRDLEFDIIVSNPPYVREKEKEKMRPNVLDNEPHLALFVKDENPLLFYNAIAQFANQNLANKGVLFFEINEFLGGNMINLLNKNHFKSIELKQDIFKKDRMIKGVKVL
ncbi:peptide chain release factor N(5)-glutamine methyltransferase [uncultured Algibacter sp.]|uniref:peptide chain release factor N(5)-glutamine methyltransferase n=1 Tax=uncultured Algibacter sp. TaxID=298659 RepID=UPI00262381B5|nr:peptide chain release factor N(5)-glutamine methyltransferase [uncultured Algibacter sp.]